jgi:hypothetical protein
MHVMYYASMLWCWQLGRILVRTNHHRLRVGCHTHVVHVGNLFLVSTRSKQPPTPGRSLGDQR